jgi:hypothetical protein
VRNGRANRGDEVCPEGDRVSGRRCRALRRAFVAENGRAPYKAKFLGYTDKREPVFDPRDEMRRVRKDHVRGLR